ncbi:uncharacterized protein L201_007648 [Kwoniella dendrophila CBS 6074]|uniref:Uncharacterized protein n=1 Tax=Kwoniella dendrophila CBS 6074 TaxID=1295534 RepID=A0AAX4K6E0_9TREE
MDPLLLAHPPTTYPQYSGMTNDEMPFDSFCIVCDRLIIPPKEVDPVEGSKTVKKKLGGGTIRVKNPDGTTTTRSANGQKVTRPGLKRNPNSAARLAALNNSSKMQPLTRTKTNDSVTSPTNEIPPNKPTDNLISPKSHKIMTPRINTAAPLFRSSIYCSKQCMEQDAGKSSEAYANIARTLSYDFSHAFPMDTPGVTVNDHSSPYGPPSPLFVSGSDTESSAASNAGGLHDSGPASSAPKFMEYFRLSKEGPDEAWNSVQRQRRSSMQPSSSQRPSTGMSHTSGPAHPSTDSLSSLCNGESDYGLGRSVSGPGKKRVMTPFQMPERERESYGAGKRSISGSTSSEYFAPIPTRVPLKRSELSQSSLLASSPSSVQGVAIPPEFGSAPSHTLDLLQSYAHAFPVRSPSGLSTSVQRGFVFPGSTSMTPESTNSRRSSMSRPVSGTIRAKSRTSCSGNHGEATWDSFGKEVVDEKNHKSHCKRTGTPCSLSTNTAIPMSVPADFRGRSSTLDHVSSSQYDTTPKQSLEKSVGGWKIKYFQPSSTLVERSGTIVDKRDRSVSRGPATNRRTSTRAVSDGNGIAIPTSTKVQLSNSTNSSMTSTSRTPLTSSSIIKMPPPATIPNRPSTTIPQAGAGNGELPDISSLNISSIPNKKSSGFNWESSEKKGMKTYEIPDAPKFKLDRNKAGLFYFQ